MASPEEDKDRPVVSVTIGHPPPTFYGRRQSSRSGLMVSIPENESTRNIEDSGDVSLLRGTTSQPSLARRLTTYLSSPVRSASKRLSAISITTRNNEYATVDEDAATDMEMIPYDLSTFAGLGLKVHDLHDSPALSPVHTPTQFTDQDTGYVGNRSDYAEHRARRRRKLGNGLEGGIRLERDLSVRQREPLSSQELLKRAQTLAQSRGKIVAVPETVPETVDLSVLEGTQLLRRTTQDTLATPGSGRLDNFEYNPESYVFPQNANVPNWKPFSITSPFILSLTILALALAGLQEYLCQWSIIQERRDNGILAFNQVAEISVADFFAWKYLPTMVTIIYAVLFSIMDFDIRRLEPYYQLSQPKGSTAAASLNLDHLTMFQYLVPFNAVRLRQWAVAVSTFGNIIAATVAPALQNPSFDFVENPNPGCVRGKGCPGGTKNYFVRINPVWSRLMTASYLLIATITVVLLILMRRKSGLLCDPKGIAGIASMATKSHILQDFHGLDLATRAQIHKRLAHRRFVLYQSSIWQGEWSAQKDPLPESDSRLKTPHPPMLRLTAAIPFIGYMVLCLIFVPLISLTRLNIIPNKAPWAPILVATILKLMWSTFEADVRLMEPFYQLSKGNAKPENSITLDYQATVYGIMPFVATFNGHFLVALVGICSVLLDILSVTAGSFSVSADILLSSLKHQTPNGFSNDEGSYNDETSVSFLTSLFLSMFILLFVILTTVLVYIRRRHPFLPREPSTIAAVLAFLYASNMLDDFIDTEKMTSAELEKKLKAGGKRYGLGWFKGRDKKVHCAIDEEPMTSKYRHGVPYASATSGPLLAHETFYPV